jgi:hypothetical protein
VTYWLNYNSKLRPLTIAAHLLDGHGESLGWSLKVFQKAAGVFRCSPETSRRPVLLQVLGSGCWVGSD